jgi:hypothetical protein
VGGKLTHAGVAEAFGMGWESVQRHLAEDARA